MKKKSDTIKYCSDYWTTAFKLINENRIMPADERGISDPIDNMYELAITDKWVMLRHRDDHRMCCKVKRHPNNDVLFPYVTILDWYLRRKLE